MKNQGRNIVAKKLFGVWMLLAACMGVGTVQAQTVEYIHTDALGTPVAVTDSNRNVIERSEYEPYGMLLNRPISNGPGYTGHVMDAATELTYMQQRYYDPTLGRFLSVDPVTANNAGGNFNRYWYANNNPYKFTDPDGRESACFATGTGCGINALTAQDQATFEDAVVTTVKAAVNLFLSQFSDGPGGAVAGVAGGVVRVGKLSTIAENAAKGKAGEAATRSKLGDKVAGEQVSFRTSDGTRARTDFVTKDKGVVETKTGNATLSPGQTKLKADIDAGRQVTPVGRNATNAGLPAGKPTTMKSCTVDRPGC